MDQNILVFNFPESAKLENAAEILKDLKAAWKTKKTLSLNLGDVEAIDLSVVQILLSAFKSAALQKRELMVLDPVPAAVFEALKLTGFVVDPSGGAQGLVDAISHYQMEGVL